VDNRQPRGSSRRHAGRGKCQFEPATLQATRPEYASFDPKVFRKHVHQEKRSLGKPILVKKKKEDKNKKNKRPTVPRKDDECEAFLQSLY
jgi:hypothetical protein